MSLLIVGLVLFFGTHSLSIVAPGVKSKAVTGIGELPWKALYSVASLAGLLAIIWGYAEARLDPQIIYIPPLWMRHIALLLLLFVFPLLLATYLRGHIKQRLKHPTLIAVKVWAFAHLLANGMLADVLLFGAFLIWAVVSIIVHKKRARGAEVEQSGATYKPRIGHDIAALVGGLLVYVAFVMWLHLWLVGVSPVSV